MINIEKEEMPSIRSTELIRIASRLFGRMRTWLVVIIALTTATGCITGPTRSMIAGKCQSATVEWVRLSEWYYLPIVAPGGLIADVCAIPVDTIFKIGDNGFYRPAKDFWAIVNDEENASKAKTVSSDIVVAGGWCLVYPIVGWAASAILIPTGWCGLAMSNVWDDGLDGVHDTIWGNAIERYLQVFVDNGEYETGTQYLSRMDKYVDSAWTWQNEFDKIRERNYAEFRIRYLNAIAANEKIDSDELRHGEQIWDDTEQLAQDSVRSHRLSLKALEYVVANSRHASVQELAMESIDDEQFCEKVVRSKGLSEKTRLMAIHKIHTQDILAEVALDNEISITVRRKAAQRIKDNDKLFECILKIKDDGVVDGLCKLISDDKKLHRIAMNGHTISLQKEAAMLIKTEELLVDVLLQTDCEEVVKDLVGRVTNDLNRVRLIKDAKLSYVKNEASKHVDDVTVIESAFKLIEDEAIRDNIVRKSKNQSLLQQIADGRLAYHNQALAISRVADDDFLANLYYEAGVSDELKKVIYDKVKGKIDARNAELKRIADEKAAAEKKRIAAIEAENKRKEALRKEQERRRADKALYLALKNGDDDAISVAIKEYAASCDRIFFVDGANKWTPLTYAAMKGNCNALKLLVAKGANVNFVDGVNNTPIGQASWSGQVNAIRELISLGARIKNSPLSAARNGQLDAVKFYVEEADVSVNAFYDGYGFLLGEAARFGQVNVFKYLVEKGCDVNLRPNSKKGGYYYSALETAVTCTNKALLAYLKDSGRVSEFYDAKSLAQKLGDECVLEFIDEWEREYEQKLQGLCGLKFGDIDAGGTPIVLGGDKGLMTRQFVPQKRFDDFDEYYCLSTPKSHRICKIYIVKSVLIGWEGSPDQLDESLRQKYKAIKPILERKYLSRCIRSYPWTMEDKKTGKKKDVGIGFKFPNGVVDFSIADKKDMEDLYGGFAWTGRALLIVATDTNLYKLGKQEAEEMEKEKVSDSADAL